MSYTKPCPYDTINFKNKDAVDIKSFEVNFRKKCATIAKLHKVLKIRICKYKIISSNRIQIETAQRL